eukprot:TRINITY_DN2516_c0_g1_i2.p1 TRINITY_DN2516_c0_g1~~TRINITY_DN2516_c0_g1_i2.p1  ORF type:complete len:117 (-),score=20.45 TRINITY_DN2516_c0_g1_i2:323-673(-)
MEKEQTNVTEEENTSIEEDPQLSLGKSNNLATHQHFGISVPPVDNEQAEEKFYKDFGRYLDYTDLTKQQIKKATDTIDNMLTRLAELGTLINTVFFFCCACNPILIIPSDFSRLFQ